MHRVEIRTYSNYSITKSTHWSKHDIQSASTDPHGSAAARASSTSGSGSRTRARAGGAGGCAAAEGSGAGGVVPAGAPGAGEVLAAVEAPAGAASAGGGVGVRTTPRSKHPPPAAQRRPSATERSAA